ncbi:sulfotransferase domain-containing protein [Rhodovulum steppense]|uniref:Sulfotransferase domain-containing protein n=1 Tax=Rhodovulum steppense TaxID=540251 RepID=A0A4R1YMN3_9RHOB|nr:sulfotransferase domain-containing protein [Rhodovulum steppense]TCM78974.1 sulfotransferase domain-containing protein [Rhodovulum steppense]
MALPDFLIIGAMKCATSTLQRQLALQDGVFMTTPKEPNYFSDDGVFARGQGWYEGLFAAAGPDDIKGEASTHYTKLPTHPATLARMQALLSHPPRLIYMIRNPLARAVSHYIHEWSQGVMSADPAEAFRAHPELVDYGRYGMQIAPYVRAYGADRVLLTSLEQLKADPDAEFSRIARFLGLSGRAAWVHDLPAQNISAERMRRLPMQGLLIDNPVARALRRTLVPKAVRRWVREARTMKARPEIPADIQDRMKARFLEDRTQLAELFPGHPALDLCYPFARS